MKAIPFFANLNDGTHCYQAALKMALTPLSGREWSFEELDKISQKKTGQWTWPTASLIWLMDQGYEVKLIEEFSYEDFGKRGKKYLEEKWGKEVADAQEANSDLKTEQKRALQLAKKIPVDHRIPTWDDLKDLFKKDHIIICNVNSRLLYKKSGYSGHFIVPIELDDDFIILHDPGLPAAPHIKVAREVFEKAWGYPTEHERNLLGIWCQALGEGF